MANVNNIANEIVRSLRQYTDEVKVKVNEAGKEVSEYGVRRLKVESPKKTGKYAQGWRLKKVGTKWVTYNKLYRLTHLLEKGHAKVNGGRVAARVHIAPVEHKMIEEYTQKVEEAIRG
ncbi:hypothetical protein [Ureibacillus sinduriensis]|uniref:HK97 gp10 family phage protein n=1 Tax=Ureibacillus sinduriensis BLB-1 = JCM 15800 TaxID=1384057 RepID=A0A0A3HQN9_9BACL|nr:hypothetical protein [Ureibacillus sinduriensis]KGR74896.1 hypothetical protein CD33_14160 [Ureibacillus sinduriensis BLB-1 = JCM 15800]